MLSERSQEMVLRLLRMGDEEIDAVMKAESADIAMPGDIVVMSKAELRGVKEQVKYTFSRAYPAIFGKELNRKLKLGLTVTDAKDINKLVQAIQAQAIKPTV